MNFKKLTAMAVSTAMLMSCTAFAADDDSAVGTITYEEAVSMAIDNTSGIATLDESMDYMEKICVSPRPAPSSCGSGI